MMTNVTYFDELPHLYELLLHNKKDVLRYYFYLDGGIRLLTLTIPKNVPMWQILDV